MPTPNPAIAEFQPATPSLGQSPQFVGYQPPNLDDKISTFAVQVMSSILHGRRLHGLRSARFLRSSCRHGPCPRCAQSPSWATARGWMSPEKSQAIRQRLPSIDPGVSSPTFLVRAKHLAISGLVAGIDLDCAAMDELRHHDERRHISALSASEWETVKSKVQS